MRKAVRLLLIAACLGLFAFSGIQVYRWWSQSRQSAQAYAELSTLAKLPEQPAAEEREKASSGSPEADHWPQVDFDALAALNPDVVGWLSCEGTPISYPVVQGNDNDYYLSHLFDGTSNPSGCLFLDSRGAADFSDRHSIIYGHYMTDGSMFASLSGYKQQNYYDAHPQLLLVTPAGTYVVEPFAGYVASVEDRAWDLEFADDGAFEAWLEDAKARSAFTSQIRPSAQDRILTLSTCSYEFQNARFVVAGVLREAEST